MKKMLFLYFAIFSIINVSWSQASKIKVIFEMKKPKITVSSDFVAKINVKNLSSSTLSIGKIPFYNLYNSEFGDIRFEIEKLNKECFKKMDFDVDIFDSETFSKKRS